MSFQNIRDTREGFVDMSTGDNLMKLEARSIGIAAFFALWLAAGVGFFPALVIGSVSCLVVPWLVGMIPAVAIVFSVVFSFAWAFIGYFIGGALLGDSVVAGILVAAIIFIISLFKHKVFAGIGYSSVEKHVIDSVDDIRQNTANTVNVINASSAVQPTQAKAVMYCTNCGEVLNVGDKFCNKCGSRQ